MAKSITEKFLDFMARYNLSVDDIVNIATEYANSDLELARTHFTDKYDIKQHVFYKARDYAIICCLVDHSLYEKIRDKSSTNYRSNNDKKSAVSSIAHFDELRIQQTQYLNEFSETEIIDIGRKYIDGVTIKNIAAAYQTGEYAIKKLLKKGIIELIFDANIVNGIKRIASGSLTSTLQQREANKKALLSCYEHQISFLRIQISYYNLYFRNAVNKPTLDSLNAQLQTANKKYNETLKL